jgi:hypothetical protein
LWDRKDHYRGKQKAQAGIPNPQGYAQNKIKELSKILDLAFLCAEMPVLKIPPWAVI